MFPACRLLAYKLVECFGQDCDDTMIAWLGEKGFSPMCDDRATMSENCQDGYPGVFDICSISTAASTSALAALVAVVFAVMLA